MINRYVGVKEETSFGTEATIPMAFDLVDGLASMDLDVPDDPNIPLPTLSRFQGRHVPGFYSPAGSMEYTLDIHTIPWFLKWTLGGYRFTAGVSPALNTHEFWATPQRTLPSFTTRTGKDTFEHVMRGCMINKMNLSIEAELATANMDIVAQRDSRTSVRTTLNTPAVGLFPIAFYNVATTLNAVDISRFVKSWEWEFDNGISVEEGQGLGSRFPYIFRGGDGECGLTIKREDETSAILDEFWASVAGPSNVSHTPFEVSSTFGSGAFGNMVVRFPRCYYKTISTTISGAELRVPDLSIGTEATEVTLAGASPPTVVTPILITVTNNRPAYNV